MDGADIGDGDGELPPLHGVDQDAGVRLVSALGPHDRPCSKEDGTFELDYVYTEEGLLEVRATLVRTGKTVMDETVSGFGVAGTSPEVQRELEALLSLDGGAAAGRRRPAPAAVAAPTTSPLRGLRPEALESLRPLVVDGSNLAWISSPRRQGGGRPSFATLLEGIAALKRRFPGWDVYVVVDATLRHDVLTDEREAVQAAIDARTVVHPPAGTQGRGDALVIEPANEADGIVVTNDNFAPFQAANPWLRTESRVLGATMCGGIWVFNPRVPPASGGVRRLR
ncbi:NYN domain-containing protein [Streptomyces sp. NPDC055254]